MIAIIAMLLLFIAPEVSKTLAHHQRMENRNDHVALYSADPMEQMPAANGHHDPVIDGMVSKMHPAVAGHTQPPQAVMAGMPDGIMMSDSACGYCVMIVHLPLMLLAFTLILWFRLRVLVARPPRFIPLRFPPVFPSLAQPRAPPAN